MPKRGRPPGSKNKDYRHVPVTLAELNKRKPGRPRGSKNGEFCICKDQKSRCPACKLTERSAYESNPEIIRFGATYSSPQDNEPYNAVIRRKCQCKACKKWRIDQSYELLT